MASRSLRTRDAPSITTGNVSIGRPPVLVDCTVQIPRRGRTAIVGDPTASTALLEVAAGLRPAVQGEIDVLGSGDLPAPHATYVPAGVPLTLSRSVEHHITAARRLDRRIDADVIRQRCRDREIDTSAKVRTLTRAQQREVVLLLALALHPEVLLLNQPFDGLDPVAEQDHRDFVVRSTTQHDTALVFSTENLSDLEGYIDFVVVIRDGRVVLQGVVTELLEQHAWYTGEAHDLDDFEFANVLCVERERARARACVLVQFATMPPTIPFRWRRDEVFLDELVLRYLRPNVPQQRPDYPQLTLILSE